MCCRKGNLLPMGQFDIRRYVYQSSHLQPISCSRASSSFLGINAAVAGYVGASPAWSQWAAGPPEWSRSWSNWPRPAGRSHWPRCPHWFISAYGGSALKLDKPLLKSSSSLFPIVLMTTTVNWGTLGAFWAIWSFLRGSEGRPHLNW